MVGLQKTPQWGQRTHRRTHGRHDDRKPRARGRHP
ncbi:MAG: hypothetical protein ACHWZW_00340 [Spirulina sp.]